MVLMGPFEGYRAVGRFVERTAIEEGMDAVRMYRMSDEAFLATGESEHFRKVRCVSGTYPDLLKGIETRPECCPDLKTVEDTLRFYAHAIATKKGIPFGLKPRAIVCVQEEPRRTPMFCLFGKPFLEKEEMYCSASVYLPKLGSN